MRRPAKRRKAETVSTKIRLAVIALFRRCSSRCIIARAGARLCPRQVREGGRDVGAGGGSGVLTYRGRDYPFRVSGLSLVLQRVHLSAGWKDGLQA